MKSGSFFCSQPMSKVHSVFVKSLQLFYNLYIKSMCLGLFSLNTFFFSPRRQLSALSIIVLCGNIMEDLEGVSITILKTNLQKRLMFHNTKLIQILPPLLIDACEIQPWHFRPYSLKPMDR